MEKARKSLFPLLIYTVGRKTRSSTGVIIIMCFLVIIASYHISQKVSSFSKTGIVLAHCANEKMQSV